ncbi:MAG: hypothetical protein JXO44_03280 [Clostridia bacterium]|nr:hypothetical protein [Clostridia bacterium]
MTSAAHFVETKDHYIYWHNTDGSITPDEATALANEIKSLAESGHYTRLIVDNSEMNGVWSNDVDKIWIDLMTYVAQYIPRTATICENIINKLQVNYLSSQTVDPDRMKAFTIKEKEEFEHYIYNKDND